MEERKLTLNDIRYRRENALAAIKLERQRQTELWGNQWTPGKISPPEKLSILLEEVGEIARELNDSPPKKVEQYPRLYEELVQVGALAVAWLESMEYQKEYFG